jgi:hypothetical protein
MKPTSSDLTRATGCKHPRLRLDNIRMYLVEVGWGDEVRIGLAQKRGRWRAFVNLVLNLPVLLCPFLLCSLFLFLTSSSSSSSSSLFSQISFDVGCMLG